MVSNVQDDDDDDDDNDDDNGDTAETQQPVLKRPGHGASAPWVWRRTMRWLAWPATYVDS
ncbi:hypothetical protein ColKHC_06424 [Colletotrichum higginsianum]|nr:hypothetical protein ColKHC_06424 [Colletotrichum higginsianum]